MIEHRLIERMIAIITRHIGTIETENRTDSGFIDAVTDFIRTYADKAHHGKEEDILFAALEKKPMAELDKALMYELVDEHVFGRETTKALVDANTRYGNGDRSALADMKEHLQTLVDFYPRHIEKEDKNFFPSTERYFTADELDAMLEDFREFDGKMDLDKYEKIVEQYESGS